VLAARSGRVVNRGYPLSDHFVRTLHQRLRNRTAKCRRSPQIDDEQELRRLLDRQVTRPRSLENSIDETCRAAEHILEVRSVGHQPARLGNFTHEIYRWQPCTRREIGQPVRRSVEHRIPVYEETVCALAHGSVYGAFQISRRKDFDHLELQSQLEGTENRIEVARRDYNEEVRKYNTLIRTFPTAIGAKVFYGAKPKVPFEAAAAAQTAPTVNFNAS